MAAVTGWDWLGIGCCVALAVFAFVRYGIEATAREWERDWEYRQRRARWAAELEDVPEDWLEQLYELRGIPEVAA